VLSDRADFGAPIFCPGGFIVSRISRHFHAEAHGLNAAAIDALRNDRFAEGASAPSPVSQLYFAVPRSSVNPAMITSKRAPFGHHAVENSGTRLAR
jgi:hypothetical protein